MKKHQTPENSILFLAVYVGDEINKTVTIFGSLQKSHIYTCSLGHEALCIVAPIKIDAEKPPAADIVGLDTITGYAVLPIKRTSTDYELARVALFGCEDFKNCSSCEMVGFYHGCQWSDSRCATGPQLSELQPNSCFNISEVEMIEGSPSFGLKIEAGYTMDSEYDLGYVAAHRDQKVYVRYLYKLYQCKFSGAKPERFSLIFKRATENLMLAT